MKKLAFGGLLVVLLVGAFLAGSWCARPNGNKGSTPGVHRVLYYTDPMNPAFRSDKPGVAPCGMDLVPVYDDGSVGGAGATGSSLPPGMVKVSPEKQQLIGVQVSRVEKAPGHRALRVLGRVVADETRLYRINAATDGWVKRILPATTDSLVAKDQLLATFYAPEFFSAMKAYLYSLRSLDRFEASRKETKEQLELTSANIDSYRNGLRNLGMTEHQLDQIQRTRQGPDQIEIRAPAAGFILARNLTLGQRFERGTELYRIADLAKVWIVADTFGSEATAFKRGMPVRVSAPHLLKTYSARVAHVSPRFDPSSRTLQVRLEADNPDFLLRPDMFVDLEVSVTSPPALTVSVDAVVDSGVKQTVFVDREEGIFEPREVEIGWRYGDRVEIVKGLTEGERIVVSGAFLLDSESRMKSAVAGAQGHRHDGQTHLTDSPTGPAPISASSGHAPEGHIHSVAEAMEMVASAHAAATAVDPICGMDVDIEKASAAGLAAAYQGKSYYFCRLDCKEKFLKEPERYAAAPAKPSGPLGSHEQGGHQP